MSIATKWRRQISAMSLEQFVDTVRSHNENHIGHNARFWLDETSIRLGVPRDSVSLAIVKKEKFRDPDSKYLVYHWATYNSDDVPVHQQIPGRLWSYKYNRNCFTALSENDPAVFGPLNELYAKSLIIIRKGFRVEIGSALPMWREDTIYDLMDEPQTISLATVLNGFKTMRPTDNPWRMSLHGEMDPHFRTLFDSSLLADPTILEGLQFQTRHERLIFRISHYKGKPRYLVYSAASDRPLQLLFSDEDETSKTLSQFKEAQMRLATPLIEPDLVLEKKLSALKARPAGRPKTKKSGSEPPVG